MGSVGQSNRNVVCAGWFESPGLRELYAERNPATHVARAPASVCWIPADPAGPRRSDDTAHLNSWDGSSRVDRPAAGFDEPLRTCFDGPFGTRIYCSSAGNAAADTTLPDLLRPPFGGNPIKPAGCGSCW